MDEAQRSTDNTRAFHVKVMRAVARGMFGTSMVLKGGTALLLCHGLDRHSEDLDFDSPRHFTIGHRARAALVGLASVEEATTLKATTLVHRVRLAYRGLNGEGNGRLKIEVSTRAGAAAAESCEVIDGVRVYRLPFLLEQKLRALESRTTARDLYDVEFISRRQPELFTPTARSALGEILGSRGGLARFGPAFEDDVLLGPEDLERISASLESFILDPSEEQQAAARARR